MKKKLLLCAVPGIVCCFESGAYAESAAYYVQSVNAKIFVAPSFKSNVIADIGMGKKVNATGTDGSWMKVSINSKEGYISSLLLSDHPPFNRVEVIKAEGPEIKEGVRRRVSSFASAASTRGLTKDDRKRADVDEGVDFHALSEAESLTYSEAEVSRFVAGGDL